MATAALFTGYVRFYAAVNTPDHRPAVHAAVLIVPHARRTQDS